MSRVCPVSGKGPVSGNNRSHSLRATRRKWNVNLQPYKVIVDGQVRTIRMSARAYRALNKSAKQKKKKHRFTKRRFFYTLLLESSCKNKE